MIGLDIYKTKDKFTVARIHYTVDPRKDPGREGQEWLKKALAGVPGGINGPHWRKEMEIDFSAYAGELLCAHIIHSHRNKIIVDKKLDETWYRYGSLDWGQNNPLSFHNYCLDNDRNIHSYYEIYQPGLSISEAKKLIANSPDFHRLKWLSADPSMWINNQQTKEGLRSLADLFFDKDYGGVSILLRKSISKSDTLAIAELMERWNNLEERQSSFTISPRCPKQIWEFERLRYEEISLALIERKNPSEQLVQKDNHAWDDWKYFVSTWLYEPKKKEKPKFEEFSLARYDEEDSLKEKEFA